MPQVNGTTIDTLEEYLAYERRAWHSAWADRGLALEYMDHEERHGVQELDRERGTKMRRARQAAST